jgi:hypothetical protein
LFAFSFYAIDHCGGKLDVAWTARPSSAWRKDEPLPPMPKINVVPRQLYQSANDYPASSINAEAECLN